MFTCSVCERKAFTGGCALYLAFSASLGWLDSAAECQAQDRGPSPVQVAAVRAKEVAPTLRVTGTVRPQSRTVVASEVAGLVAELPVDVGDRVIQGQLLCRLRDAQRRFAHDQALARRGEMTAAVAAQEADVAKAKFEMERVARLGEQHGTGKEQQDTRADFEAAKARLEQARFAVEGQDAVVRAMADDLARTEIHAPFDGYVVAKRTEVGSWVNQGGEVVEMVCVSTVRIRVPVIESAVPFCTLGEEVVIQVEATGKSFVGKISRVIPDADERARTFPVEIDVPNPHGELKPGMFVRAAVPSGPKAERLLAPKDAVVVRGPTSMVYVVRPGESGAMAVPMPVEVVSEVVDYVAVMSPGLAAGDQVVVRGNEYMFGPTPVMPSPAGGVSTSMPTTEEAATAQPASAPASQD